MGFYDWLKQDVREFGAEMRSKKAKCAAACSPEYAVHERAYILFSLAMPHLFPIPQEKPFPRHFLFQTALSLMLLAGMLYVGGVLSGMDYSCYGGDINIILKEHYGIGDPEDLRWCAMIKNMTGEKSYGIDNLRS